VSPSVSKPCLDETVVIRARDDATLITPEIMEDIAQLLFMAIVDMSDEAKLQFRN
jgi:hypothetical protein